jgi:hypothetical protein
MDFSSGGVCIEAVVGMRAAQPVLSQDSNAKQPP